MNWWTALGWCSAIKKTMIQYPEDCRCLGENCPTTETGCPNFFNTHNTGYKVWTSTPYLNTSAYLININDGTVSTGLRNSWAFGALTVCK